MELVDIFYKRAIMFWKSFLGLIIIYLYSAFVVLLYNKTAYKTSF